MIAYIPIENRTITLLSLPLVSASFIPLLFVQQAINYVSRQTGGELHKTFSLGELVVTIAGILIFVISFTASFIAGFLNEEVATSAEEEGLAPQNVILQADYNEGYKAGYADGRASKGQLGDSYREPATLERRPAYSLGYLEGFLKGCKEGDFNCNEVEVALNEIYKEVNADELPIRLIPSDIQ